MPSALTSRARPLLLVLLVVICLLVAVQTARVLGLESARVLLCLTNLATLVICIRLSWRQALVAVGGLAALAVPAVLSQNDPLPATAVIMVAALALGLSARRQLQPVYWLMMVSVCLLITQSTLPAAASASQLTALVIAVLTSGGLTILLHSVLLGSRAGRQGQAVPAVAHSWRRCLAYGLLLASTALITTPIAVLHHWHTNGLWLILTPFLVLKPFIRDSWRVALHRSLGTLAGVALVIALARILPHSLPIQIPAVAMAVITATIAARHGHPALMVTAFTATIVVFNSNPSDLPLMADHRLQACGIGIAISLGVMALAHPIEQRLQTRRS